MQSVILCLAIFSAGCPDCKAPLAPAPLPQKPRGQWDGNCLVFFTAEWCRACKAAPMQMLWHQLYAESLAGPNKGIWRCYVYDVDNSPGWKPEKAVSTLPTIVLFVDFTEVKRWTGMQEIDLKEIRDTAARPHIPPLPKNKASPSATAKDKSGIGQAEVPGASPAGRPDGNTKTSPDTSPRPLEARQPASSTASKPEKKKSEPGSESFGGVRLEKKRGNAKEVVPWLP